MDLQLGKLKKKEGKILDRSACHYKSRTEHEKAYKQSRAQTLIVMDDICGS